MKRTTLFCCATLLSLCFGTTKAIAQDEISCVDANQVIGNPAELISATCIYLSDEAIERYSEVEGEFESDYETFLVYDQAVDKYPTALFFIQPVKYGYGILVAELYPETTDIEKQVELFAQGEAIVENSEDQEMLDKYEPELKAAIRMLRLNQITAAIQGKES